MSFGEPHLTFKEVDRHGSSFVDVFTKINYRQPAGARKYIVIEVPQAFKMVREGDRWRLLDDFFVQRSIAVAYRRSR